jgi:hypothetical protein
MTAKGPVDTERADQVVDLVCAGWTFRQVGDLLGITRQRAWKIWCQMTDDPE